MSVNVLSATARNVRIDLLRCVVIVFVVTLHVMPDEKARWISFFTMPLAFALSGHLHHPRGTWGEFAKDKALSLMVPYASYLVVIGALWTPHALRDGETLAGWIGKLLYGGLALKGALGIFWFMTCLYITQQLFNACLAAPALRARIMWVALASYALALVNDLALGSAGLPLAANVALMAFLFYAFGYTYGAWMLGRISRPVLALAALCAITGFALEARFHNVHVNMKHTEYGWPVVTPLISISVMICLAQLVGWIERVGPLCRAMRFVGSCAVTILFVHQSLQYGLMERFADEHPLAAIAIFVAVSCGVHLVLKQFRWTRALFLGSRRDWRGKDHAGDPSRAERAPG